MAVSVVELSTVDNAGSGTTASVTFAETPAAGDVVVLSVFGSSGASTNVPTVSGLGATWATHVAVQSTSNPTGTITFLIGTGATSAGTVSLTWPVTSNHIVRGFLVRGLTSTTVVTADLNSTSSTSAFTGPRLTAAVGQFALAFFHATNGTITNTTFPAAPSLPSVEAWTAQDKYNTSATNGTAYHIPGALGDVGTAATSAGNYYHRQVLLILGSPANAAPHGAATGSVAWGGAATGKTIARSAVAGAFGWAGEATGPITGVAHGSATGSFGWVGETGAAQSVSLEPWTADESRKTRAVAVTSGAFDFTPPLDLPPEGVAERVLMRESVIVPDLTTLDGVITDPVTGHLRVPDAVFAALPRVEEEVGVPHVVFPNVGDINDRTYFRGGLIKPLRDRREEPFGDATLTLDLSQVTSLDEYPHAEGGHPLAWTMNRANVEIVIRKTDGAVRRGVWTGHVVAQDTGNTERDASKSLTCVGTLRQASTDVHKPAPFLDPTDIGSLIGKALNTVASRRYPKLRTVTTGIVSRNRGAWSDSPLAYVQGLLATAHTTAGRQWTVAKVEGTRRTYELRLKKTTPEWTVTNGAPGVQVSLSRDETTCRNVVYGHGVGTDGYAWWNYHYPNLRQDDAPAYPYSSAGTVMSVGSTDAGTSSGEGVSVWQRRARDLGYNVTVNGFFDSDDERAARAIQSRYGLQVDGVVGPQTWAGTFDVGGNGGDLTGAIRLPLAADPRSQRFLYNADGSVAGDNPEYDPGVIIYADDVDFGAGVSREEGIEAARQIVARESDPGLVGRIVLNADPREGSRLLIPPGDKLTLIGWERSDVVLHIAAVERDWENLTVTLEVDSKSRDAMTWQQIRSRNKEARKDPARRPGNVNRRSRLEVDQVVPFDGESGAGWIPKHALYGGLWTVIRVPVSELGRVAKIDLRTSGPASKFAVALFGAPITPAHLVKYVGNPLASDSPFEAHAELLEDRFGFIEGWGQNGQAGGYWPGSEGESSLTGRLVDAGGFEYVSARPPWVWVAEYAAASTFISGRILPAPIQ